MVYLVFYLAGSVLVWLADKRSSYETGWVSLSVRVGVSLLSWLGVFVFIFISVFRYSGELLEKKYDYNLPKWL